jgi:long-chain acyl-CoA synthetase
MGPRPFASLGAFVDELGHAWPRDAAFRTAGDVISRGDLAARARRMAARWRAAGLVPGDVVGIVGETGPAVALALFSAARAGLVPLLLDPRLNSDEADAVVGRAAPKAFAVCAGSEWADTGSRPIFNFNHHGETSLPTCSREASAPSPPDDPHAPAVLIVTSGTSGHPRVVALSAHNLSSNLRASYAAHPCERGEVFLSLLPLTHAFELTTGLLGPLSVGASIVFPPSRNPNSLLRIVQAEHVTHVNVVPAILKMIVAELRDGAGGSSAAGVLARQLKSVVCGGAAPTRDFVDVLVAAGVPLWLGYGLTEASPSVAVGRAARLPPGAAGRALPGVELRVERETGELLVRGPGVMIGYYRDPNATAAVMADGWLHTGDLARLDVAGHVFILGRLRDLIVTGAGLKVLPDDVESAYRSPLFGEVCAVGVPDPDAGGGETPCLVVVPSSGTVGSEAAIAAEFQRLSVLAGARRAFRWALRTSPLPRTRTLKLRRDLIRESILAGGEDSHVSR